LRPRHTFHDGHDFNCSGGTKRIAHRFPHLTVGRFRISSRHGHKRILSGWQNLCALKALRPTVKLGTYVHIIYLGA
jgi:hypothetical protein